MSPSAYKVIHVVGLILLFMSLAGLLTASVSGVKSSRRLRASLSSAHGLGLVLLLISGFGMLAKLGYLASLPTWAIIKFGLWVALGGSLALAKRRPRWAVALITFWVGAGGLAAYLCVYKPG